jgi:hypothetical protein
MRRQWALSGDLWKDVFGREWHLGIPSMQSQQRAEDCDHDLEAFDRAGYKRVNSVANQQHPNPPFHSYCQYDLV